ncbi:ATP synthase gamma chain [Pseudohyphozyma bogoriensis]|nr:ATP synthase gamma chain [Pseudohyphozyma bogoriensis]
MSLLARSVRTASVPMRAASARSFSSTPVAEATLKELEMRIKSVGNIGKITKSMKMVAASRLARAQRAMDSAKLYGQANETVYEQSQAANSEAKVEKILYVTISSDRGLCGGIHSSVSKATKRDIEGGEGVGKDVSLIALGDKPKQQLSRSANLAGDVVLSFNQIGRRVPTFSEALSIADKIEESGVEYDKVKIFYNKFVSVISYEASVFEVYSNKALQAAPAYGAYEVAEDNLAADLSSFALANAIYAGLVEGHASEISARRNAMDNASKNAEEMIVKLQTQFNRMRQASITNELIDIITGASAYAHAHGPAASQTVSVMRLVKGSLRMADPVRGDDLSSMLETTVLGSAMLRPFGEKVRPPFLLSPIYVNSQKGKQKDLIGRKNQALALKALQARFEVELGREGLCHLRSVNFTLSLWDFKSEAVDIAELSPSPPVVEIIHLLYLAAGVKFTSHTAILGTDLDQSHQEATSCFGDMQLTDNPASFATYGMKRSTVLATLSRRVWDALFALPPVTSDKDPRGATSERIARIGAVALATRICRHSETVGLGERMKMRELIAWAAEEAFTLLNGDKVGSLSREERFWVENAGASPTIHRRHSAPLRQPPNHDPSPTTLKHLTNVIFDPDFHTTLTTELNAYIAPAITAIYNLHASAALSPTFLSTPQGLQAFMAVYRDHSKTLDDTWIALMDDARMGGASEERVWAVLRRVYVVELRLLGVGLMVQGAMKGRESSQGDEKATRGTAPFGLQRMIRKMALIVIAAMLEDEFDRLPPRDQEW